MPQAKNPVLSIIVRRFAPAEKDAVLQALGALQEAAAKRSDYLGHHNSLDCTEESCELVNAFAFSSREALENWERSETRKAHLEKLDALPITATRHADIDGLAQLLPPTAQLRKAEIVLILIFWITALGTGLGALADALLPAAAPNGFWRSLSLITVNVLLISYLLLPWSSRALLWLKARIR